jgi:ATP-dependent DNA helicase RecQ
VSVGIDVMKASIQEREQLMQRFALNEIQFRILAQLIGSPPYRLSKLDSLKQFFQIRRESNLLKVAQFMKWISNSECRRVEIMKYFDENQRLDHPHCCDNCGETVQGLLKHLPAVAAEKNGAYSDWRKALASMLLKADDGS